jgi:hypothetical protein
MKFEGDKHYLLSNLIFQTEKSVLKHNQSLYKIPSLNHLKISNQPIFQQILKI